jgi:hypothetical protein
LAHGAVAWTILPPFLVIVMTILREASLLAVAMSAGRAVNLAAQVDSLCRYERHLGGLDGAFTGEYRFGGRPAANELRKIYLISASAKPSGAEIGFRGAKCQSATASLPGTVEAIDAEPAPLMLVIRGPELTSISLQESMNHFIDMLGDNIENAHGKRIPIVFVSDTYTIEAVREPT